MTDTCTPRSAAETDDKKRELAANQAMEKTSHSLTRKYKTYPHW